MRKCKIHCYSHMDEHREFDITSDGRVWPCCYYANLWDLRDDPETDLPLKITDDSELMELVEEDPDWNNLKKHSLEDIINHDIYWSHLYIEGWESDNPSPICAHECGEYIDDVTGKTTQKSRLD
jgi:hypothetical protein